jgi:hypothetical protein
LLVHYAIPALAYFGIALAMRRTISPDDFKWFAPNYLIMAAPHIALGVAAFVFRSWRSKLSGSLLVANAALVLFVIWLLVRVPPRETGLAWLYYFPFAGAALAFALASFLILSKPGR